MAKQRQAIIDESLFDEWLKSQSPRFTYILISPFTLIGIIQIYLHWNELSARQNAAILKFSHLGQNLTHGYLYFTTTFLHGSILHWFMNASALFYLGKRVEALARWQHMVTVYFIALMAGSMASVHFLPTTPSVGASGGILGLLGFLLIYECLHAKLVPRTARKRLLTVALTTATAGILGFHFIDNAAHAGGFCAAAIYAVIAFPPSQSAQRPQMNFMEQVFGISALVAILLSAIGTIWILLFS